MPAIPPVVLRFLFTVIALWGASAAFFWLLLPHIVGWLRRTRPEILRFMPKTFLLPPTLAACGMMFLALDGSSSVLSMFDVVILLLACILGYRNVLIIINKTRLTHTEAQA